MRKRKDGSWFQALYAREYALLIRTACRLTGEEALAQDLVQDTFVLALLHQQELAEHPHAEAWLLRTLHNLARNAERARARAALPLEEAEAVPAAAEAPLEELLPARLTEEERQLLLWRFRWQLSCREMAERLGISEAACRKRLSRALNRCRALLGESG